MSNETKRDVFDDAVNELEDVLPDTALFGSEYIADMVGELRARYTAALPDDLPVIPKVWGDTIEEFKANHYKLSELFNEWDWNYDEQELIARAWLDGYQVEEAD